MAISIQMYWPGIPDEQKGQQNFEMYLQYNDNNSYALLKLYILFATYCTKYFILDHLLKQQFWVRSIVLILQMEKLKFGEINFIEGIVSWL